MSQPVFRIRTSIFARLGLYYAVCWGILALLTLSASPLALVAVIAVAIYTTAPLIFFLRHGGWTSYPTARYRLFVVRPLLYAQTSLPLIAGSGVLGLLIGAAVGQPMSIGRWFAAAVTMALILMFVVGYAGTRRLAVHELEASLPNLPPEFDGATIAQITDLHVGPQSSRRYLRRIVRAVESSQPDVIVVTGDQIDDHPEDVAQYAAAFGGLRAPHGVFVIAGNHDVYAGWDDVDRELRAQVPATLLLNQACALHRDGAVLYLAGTGDPAGMQTHTPRAAPDIDRTLSAVPRGAPVIALAHNPALWPALADRGVALTLSGHTHWGQFSIPQWGWSLASPFLDYAMGVYQRDNALLYIAPGTGFWGLPFRIGAPPEVTRFTLRRGAAAIRDLGRHAARDTRQDVTRHAPA